MFGYDIEMEMLADELVMMSSANNIVQEAPFVNPTYAKILSDRANKVMQMRDLAKTQGTLNTGKPTNVNFVHVNTGTPTNTTSPSSNNVSNTPQRDGSVGRTSSGTSSTPTPSPTSTTPTSSGNKYKFTVPDIQYDFSKFRPSTTTTSASTTMKPNVSNRKPLVYGSTDYYDAKHAINHPEDKKPLSSKSTAQLQQESKDRMSRIQSLVSQLNNREMTPIQKQMAADKEYRSATGGSMVKGTNWHAAMNSTNKPGSSINTSGGNLAIKDGLATVPQKNGPVGRTA